WRDRSSEGRHPSFHFWQAYSPFSTWSKIWKGWQGCKESPEKLRTFYQQVLAEPYEAAHDKPDWEGLRDAMQSEPVKAAARVVRGVVPDWAAVLTGSADQQGDRIEWAVWAWGPGRRGARIDSGVIPISPADPRAWVELARVSATEYEGPAFAPRRCDRFCVDTGGHYTSEAYKAAHQFGIKAIKGAPNNPDAPPMTLSTTKGKYRNEQGRRVQGVPLFLIGTHNLKKAIYHGLAQTMLTAAGDGATIEPCSLFLPPDSADADYKQITAESLVEDVVNGRRVVKWTKAKQDSNEQLDLAVYALAEAIGFGIDRFSTEQWFELFSKRMKDPELADMGPLEQMMRRGEPDLPAPQQAPRGEPDWVKKMKELNRNG
ncbi:MAG: terminase gpA endonuclease subunit, partial [Pseudomonadota bacterium]|nr:terminase gpA endonuclease subunit [Pseudomonadota bacterium]